MVSSNPLAQVLPRSAPVLLKMRPRVILLDSRSVAALAAGQLGPPPPLPDRRHARCRSAAVRQARLGAEPSIARPQMAGESAQRRRVVPQGFPALGRQVCPLS